MFLYLQESSAPRGSANPRRVPIEFPWLWCFPPFQRAFTTGLWNQGGDVLRLDNHGSAFAEIISDSPRTDLELEPQRSSII